jgi:hypothetical protein
MTQLNPEQVKELLAAVSDAVPDAMTCDQCFELISVFVDSQLQGTPPVVSLEAVATHLKQCPCCAFEYETLLTSLAVDPQESV